MTSWMDLHAFKQHVPYVHRQSAKAPVWQMKKRLIYKKQQKNVYLSTKQQVQYIKIVLFTFLMRSILFINSKWCYHFAWIYNNNNSNCFSLGDVMCAKCQHNFSFNAIEQFFTKSLRSTDLDRARDLFLKSKPKVINLVSENIQQGVRPVNEMQTVELQEIIDHLGIVNINAAVFQNIQAFCDPRQKAVYFPMQDIGMNIIGYKKLMASADGHTTEVTYPERNSLGAVILNPIVKRGYRDQKTAILVLNMLDALALRTEKCNS